MIYTKLGYFCIDNYDSFVSEMVNARPRVIKTGDPGLLRVLYDALGPGVTYIARNFAEIDDFARWDNGRILTDPVGAAKYWVDAWHPTMKAIPFAFIESFNEMSNWQWMRQYGLFEAERQRLMALEGYKAAIGCFSTGSPPIKPDLDEPWEQFYPALAACNQYHNLLSLHEYGGLYLDLFYGPNQREAMLAGHHALMPDIYADGWLFGRYRKVWDTHIEPNGWTNIRIVLTELGLDRAGTDVIDALAGGSIGPWTQCLRYWSEHDHRPDGAAFYAEQLKWADRQMQADPYMVGATIFCRGARSEVWQQWDIRDAVASHLDPYTAANRPGKTSRVVTPRNNLYLRIRPNKLSAAIRVLGYGEIVEVVSDSGGWSYIKTQAGHEGYCMSQFLTKAA